MLIPAMRQTLLPRFLFPVALAGALCVGGCHSNSNQQQPAQTAQQPMQNQAPPPSAAGDQNGAAQQSAMNGQQAAPPAAEQQGAPQYAAKQPPAPQYKESQPAAQSAAAAAPVSYTIPAGTAIRISLGQTLSSKTSQSGQPFQGTVAAPVVVRGRTVIRAGSAASGTIVTATTRGRFKGAGELDLRLDTIRAGGRDVPVQTSSIERVEKGKGKRTALFAGGGGGLGALIGGLAGGGKGALIGGLAGAGAGGAGGAFTGNQQVTIPAETVLVFRLDNSVTVR